MSINNVPCDVFLIIASYTDPADYQNMRLVSKSFKTQLDKDCFSAKSLLRVMKTRETAQMNIVSRRGSDIETISNPSERVQLAAILQCGFSVTKIQNTVTDRAYAVAIQQIGYESKIIQYPSEQLVPKNFEIIEAGIAYLKRRRIKE